MDVATSLVVNHVNLGALYLLCCICVYGYVSIVLRRIYITVKEVNYNLWICMNAKICKDVLSAQLTDNKVEVDLC